MKTHKPIKLGVYTKTFPDEGRHLMVLTLLVGVPFDEPDQLVDEADIWKVASEQMGEGMILDELMWKDRGELLVSGSAFAKGGEPTTACAVRVALGPIDKTLHVVGDRHWTAKGASDPVPFTSMPLVHERAFGGEGHPDNPLGRGLAPVEEEHGPIHRLPNLEHPKQRVQRPGDRPPPVGFEPLRLAWPKRLKKLGTYDEAWLRTRCPAYAADIDWSAFNMAPTDQQLKEGFFAGDEPFRVEHMHPTRPVIEGTLPARRGRAFVRQRRADEAVFREIPLRLDTVRLFPSAELGVLSFRGVFEVSDADGDDVEQLIAGVEAIAEPKPEAHYRAVLDKRLDPERGGLESLRESDLLPAGCRPTIVLDEPSPDAPVGYLKDHALNRADAELELAREQLRDRGLDPDEHIPEAIPRTPPARSVDDIYERVAEAEAFAQKAQADAARRQAEAEADARARLAEHGLDYDAMVQEAKRGQGGPPKAFAQKQIEQLMDRLQLALNAGVAIDDVQAQLSDPALADKLMKAEAIQLDAYRRFAQHMPAAVPLGDDDSEALRREVRAAVESGTSLSGRDFTGADLSKLRLAGVDLSDAFLEAADLSDCDLSGANLTGAVLARAKLDAADLRDANLRGANLGKASLRGAMLDGATLDGGCLEDADLRGTSLVGARLAGADISGAQLTGADLSNVVAPKLVVIHQSLAEANLRGITLDRATFVEADLSGIDLSGAVLTKVNFVDCRADGIKLAGAKAANTRFVAGTSVVGGDFKGADLTRSCFLGAKATGADFSGANLDKANLMKADLTEARFCHTRAREAQLSKADLRRADLTGADMMLAVLEGADIRSADFKGANLFRADFDRIKGDEATSFDKANMKRIRFFKATQPEAPPSASGPEEAT